MPRAATADGIAIYNIGDTNHLQCFIQLQFPHFDIPAFIFKPAVLAGFQVVVIGNKD